jgi:hypothetical protein
MEMFACQAAGEADDSTLRRLESKLRAAAGLSWVDMAASLEKSLLKKGHPPPFRLSFLIQIVPFSGHGVSSRINQEHSFALGFAFSAFERRYPGPAYRCDTSRRQMSPRFPVQICVILRPFTVYRIDI